MSVSRVIAKFNVTLISKDTGENPKIPPFIVVQATPTAGQLKEKYASNRKICLVKKRECVILESLEAPPEHEWMKPYSCVSREVVRDFVR